jgi:hypothetical protein
VLGLQACTTIMANGGRIPKAWDQILSGCYVIVKDISYFKVLFSIGKIIKYGLL